MYGLYCECDNFLNDRFAGILCEGKGTCDGDGVNAT